MTDLRDITSTSNTTKNIHGRTIHTVRDSLLVELMLSTIVAITIVSLMTLVKAYIAIIEVSIIPPFSVIIVALLHTIIRRLKIDGIPLLVILHLLVSALFYRVAIMFPVLEFGRSGANKFYLIVVLIALTLFSIIYRLKHSFSATDKEFFAFAGGLQVIAYILCAISGSRDLARSIMVNAVIIAIIYIIMRQIAVFDAKYYHSIHKLSRSSSLLKKQNNKTVLFLIGVIAVTLGVLKIFPYQVTEAISDLLMRGFVAFLQLFSFLFKDNIPDFSTVPMQPTELEELPGYVPREHPFLGVFVKLMVILAIALLIFAIANIIRMLIKNAAKVSKIKELKDDDKLIDTIEEIPPEKTRRLTRSRNFGTGYEKKIRKKFYEKTRRAMKKGLPVFDSSTPGQIEKVLLENGDKDIASLRQEYEKVRYGK